MSKQNRNELSSLIRCPINWHTRCPNQLFGEWLSYLWFIEVQNNQVDFESRIVNGENAFEVDEEYVRELADTEVERILGSVKRWIDFAKKSYLKKNSRFENFMVADRTQYEKHYLNANESEEEARQRSNSGVSILNHRLQPGIQTTLAWRCIVAALESDTNTHPNASDNIGNHRQVGEKIDAFLLGPKLLVANDCSEPCGWARGTITRFLMWDFDFSTPLAHCYPVSEKEFLACAVHTDVALSLLDDLEDSYN